MTIGVYIAYTSIKGGGIFTYANGLINMLLKENEIEKLIIFYSIEQKALLKYLKDKNKKIMPKLISINENLIQSSLLKLAKFIFFLHEEELITNRSIIKIYKLLNPYKKIFDSIDADVIHVPFQISPVYHTKTPIIITLHDVQDIHFPEFFSSKERKKRAVVFNRSTTHSHHIIVSFDHVRNDVIKYFQVPESKVSVCALPFADEWFQDNISENQQILKERYNLFDHFLLYPAATWKHKNHLGLFTALNLLRQNNKKINLICTGNLTEHYDELKKELVKLSLESQVKFLGVIPERDLIGLYKLTNLVVIPTFYEAGSGPLFEAMRYGVPVICSNVTSLPETIGNKEFYFDPNSPTEMAELIEKGCYDERYRKRNLENSKKRMHYYKNLNVIRNFLDVYKSLAK